MKDLKQRYLILSVVLLSAVLIVSGSTFASREDSSAKACSLLEAANQAYSVYTIYVPDDFVTIQGALNTAAAIYMTQSPLDAATNIYTFSTIIVRDGIYAGPGNRNLDFKGYPTYLRSENGPEGCIIDCERDHRGFYFDDDETPASVLEGFTILNASGDAITCVDSSPSIIGCVMRGGNVGIDCNDSSPRIIDCEIYENSSYGINCRDSSNPYIESCDIRQNGGFGIRAGTDHLIVNCNISGNGLGGIMCGTGSSPRVINCTIVGNQNFFRGGGVSCSLAGSQSGPPKLVNCILRDNSSPLGPQIALFGSDLTVINCDVEEGAGDVYVDEHSTLNWGPGNIDEYPQFVAPGYWDGGAWVDGDYHLTAGSPCIDAGKDVRVDRDIDTDNRPNGAGFDMGSDEYYDPGTPRIGVSPASLMNLGWQGEGAPPQQITVRNSGGGALVYSVTDDAPWLAGVPAGGISIGEPDPITVLYGTAGLEGGVYFAEITVSDPNASNNPQSVDVLLAVGESNLTRINCDFPPTGAVLFSAPTFTWTVDGGRRNFYIVDMALSPAGPIFSTWENLRLPITDESWAMPPALWNLIPHGRSVYWRVRGANLNQAPPILIFSDEVRWFYKP